MVVDRIIEEFLISNLDIPLERSIIVLIAIITIEYHLSKWKYEDFSTEFQLSISPILTSLLLVDDSGVIDEEERTHYWHIQGSQEEMEEKEKREKEE